MRRFGDGTAVLGEGGCGSLNPGVILFFWDLRCMQTLFLEICQILGGRSNQLSNELAVW